MVIPNDFSYITVSSIIFDIYIFYSAPFGKPEIIVKNQTILNNKMQIPTIISNKPRRAQRTPRVRSDTSSVFLGDLHASEA
jgi:hypothetical protein